MLNTSVGVLQLLCSYKTMFTLDKHFVRLYELMLQLANAEYVLNF